MKIEKKRGINKVRIQHNKKLLWVIIALMVILICLVVYLAVQNEKQKAEKECAKNEDCVPATCCHPNSCVPTEKAQICEARICSMVCSGPLDCSAGYCGCIEGKCKVIPNK